MPQFNQFSPEPAVWTPPRENLAVPSAEPLHTETIRVVPTTLCGPLSEVLPRKMKVKHHVEGRARPSELGTEVASLYDAMSFKTLRDGRGFDTLITISAWYLGLTNHAEFAALIQMMNKAIQGWLNARPKRSARWFLQSEQLQHSYLYVLERGWKHGLHCHLMCSVPPELQREFRIFIGAWWQWQAVMAIPDNAVNVKFAHMKTEFAQYEKQQFWFRYLIKSMKPGMCVGDQSGQWRYAEEVFKPLWRYGSRPDSRPIRARQLYGISRDLDMKARQDWGNQSGRMFQSKISQGRLDELYSGSEVQEFQRAAVQRWLNI